MWSRENKRSLFLWLGSWGEPPKLMMGGGGAPSSHCIAAAWVIPHNALRTDGDPAAVLWSEEMGKYWKRNIVSMGGVTDDLILRKKAACSRKKRELLSFCALDSCPWRPVGWDLHLICWFAFATHRFRPDIVSTLSVNDVLLRRKDAFISFICIKSTSMTEMTITAALKVISEFKLILWRMCYKTIRNVRVLLSHIVLWAKICS